MQTLQSRWKEYIEDQYDKYNKPFSDEMKTAIVGEDSMGPELYDEFEKAFSELKNGKATNIDVMPVGILKALERIVWQALIVCDLLGHFQEGSLAKIFHGICCHSDSLPQVVTSAPTLRPTVFRNRLKTYFFPDHFPQLFSASSSVDRV